MDSTGYIALTPVVLVESFEFRTKEVIFFSCQSELLIHCLEHVFDSMKVCCFLSWNVRKSKSMECSSFILWSSSLFLEIVLDAKRITSSAGSSK